jgi:hypothetical protein
MSSDDWAYRLHRAKPYPKRRRSTATIVVAVVCCAILLFSSTILTPRQTYAHSGGARTPPNALVLATHDHR